MSKEPIAKEFHNVALLKIYRTKVKEIEKRILKLGGLKEVFSNSIPQGILPYLFDHNEENTGHTHENTKNIKDS